MNQTRLTTVSGRLQHDKADTEAKRQRRAESEATAGAAIDVQTLAAQFCAAELHLLGLPQLARMREVLNLAAERARTMHKPDWSALPADIWYLVLQRCSAPMANALALTCRSLRAIVKHRARRLRLTLTHMNSAQQQCTAKLVIDRRLLHDKQYITFVGPVCTRTLRMLLDELRKVQKNKYGHAIKRLKLIGGIVNGYLVSSIRGDPIYYARGRFNSVGELRLQMQHLTEDKQAPILVQSIPHDILTYVNGCSTVGGMPFWSEHCVGLVDLRRVPHSRPLPSSPRQYGFFWSNAQNTVDPMNLMRVIQWRGVSVSRIKVDNITLFPNQRILEPYINRTCNIVLCITMRLYGATDRAHSLATILASLRGVAYTYLTHFKETRLKIVHTSGVVERWHMTGDVAAQYRHETLDLQA